MVRNASYRVFLAVALALLCAQPARADYQAGRTAWDAGRFAEAVAEWQAAAGRGDVQSMLALGRAFVKGTGVPQDFVEAHQWLNLAAARGNAEAAAERDELSKRMTPGQIASAQDRVRAWRPGGRTAAVPPTAASDPPPAGPPPKRALVEAQGLLATLGYKPGVADGIWGRRAIEAYRAFLKDSGMPSTEVLTPEALRAMRKAVGGRDTSKPVKRATKSAPDLHRIAKAGDIDGLKTALANPGIKVNARDGRGWTALMHVAHKGYTLMVPSLLRAKADPNIRAADGATALFIAALGGNAEIFAALLEAGADPKIEGPKGVTPLELAQRQTNIAALPEVITLIRAEALSGAPKCEGEGDAGSGCWIELADKPGCHVWKDIAVQSNLWHQYNNHPVTWSGSCSDGVAVGRGELSVYHRKYDYIKRKQKYKHEGELIDGKKHGQWIETYSPGSYYDPDRRFGHRIRTDRGVHVKGKRHGQWTIKFTGKSGAPMTWTGSYANGVADGRWKNQYRVLANKPWEFIEYYYVEGKESDD